MQLKRRSIRLVFNNALLVMALGLGVSLVSAACGSEESDAPETAAVVKPAEQVEGADAVEAELEELLSPEFEKLRAAFTGDLDEMMQRTVVRVLVSPSRTNFFFADRQARGFDVELMTAFEDHLNTGRKRSERVRVVFLPMPFETLLPALEKGMGDVVAASMTVMPEREVSATFSDPYLKGVAEVVVYHKSVSDIRELRDLAGRRVSVRSGASYVEHLGNLNKTFEDQGLDAIDVHEVGPYLATEDVLEMVNSGFLDVTVADHYLAEAWAQVMPGLVVRKDLTIHDGGRLAFAVRPGNPDLLASLNAFVAKNRKGTLLGNILFTRYFEKKTWLKDPSEPAVSKRFQNLIGLFQTYSTKYGFDWLGIAAQAFQESGFDQSKKSRAGAVGMMQIRPATAADKNVGIPDVNNLEDNVHAGVKYLHFIRDRYFSDEGLSDQDRVNFALAAYNAGPKRIVAARSAAEKQGLDPNQWFFNVENIVSRTVGSEPVDYVRNIRAYWVAFRLMYEELQRRDAERDRIQ